MWLLILAKLGAALLMVLASILVIRFCWQADRAGQIRMTPTRRRQFLKEEEPMKKALVVLALLFVPAVSQATVIVVHDCRVARVDVKVTRGAPSATYPAGYYRFRAAYLAATGAPLSTVRCPDQNNPGWTFDPTLRVDGATQWDVSLDRFGFDILVRAENLNPGSHWIYVDVLQSWRGPGLSSPATAPPGYAYRFVKRSFEVR